LSALTSTINTVNTAFLTSTTAFVGSGRPAARSAGRRRVGSCHRRHGRHQHDQHSHPRRVEGNACNTPRHGRADLQYEDQAGLLGLPSRPRHLDPERRGHRGQLALGRDRRYLEARPKTSRRPGLTSPIFGGTFTTPPGPSARTPGAVRWDLHGLHSNLSLTVKPASISEQFSDSRLRGLFRGRRAASL
jgi:hypothetical protein